MLSKWQKARSVNNYNTDTANVSLLNQLSEQYLYNHTDSSLSFAKQGLQMAQSQKKTLGEAWSLMNIARNYYIMGEYILSLDMSTKLMNISNKINFKPGIAGAYQLIGLIYQAENKNVEAIENLKKALDLYITLKDDSKTGKAYFNIGLCYDEMGQPEKSFPYLNKAIEFANKSVDNNLVSMVLNRTAEANFHLKNYNQALNYYQQVIDSKFSSIWETSFALSGMAQTYYEINEYEKAISNAQKSLSLQQKVKSEQDRVRALMVLTKSYAAINDYKHAYNYQILFKEASDGLLKNEKNKEVSDLHLKQQQADNTRLVNELKIKEQTIAFSKKLLFFRNLIAVCVCIFFITIIRSNRQKTALNRVLQKQNADIALQKAEISQQKETLHQLNHTKDQLFSVISHDLRSPFAAILQAMDGMRAGDMSAGEQAEVLDAFYQQVALVNLMVNNLLVWASSQQAGNKTETALLNVTEAVDEIISVSNFLAKSKRIDLLHDNDSDKFIMADLNHVKIILQNLIGNAIKFTPHGGTIEIFYTTNEDYQVIHIKDNGIGILPQKMEKLFKVTGKGISGYGTNNEAGAGIGLALIKQFVDANNGKLEVQSKPGEGTEFIVYLEKAENS